MAVPLLIFAATICWNWDPNGRLLPIRQGQSISRASKFDRTYIPVLQQLMFGCSTDDLEKESVAHEFRKIIGTIVILAGPLPTSALARLLSISKKAIDNRLHCLHSVFKVPSERDSPVRLLHRSFYDFLLDPKNEGNNELWFWIDRTKTHEMIATKCLPRNAVYFAKSRVS
jgi:hypothetical protein